MNSTASSSSVVELLPTKSTTPHQSTNRPKLGSRWINFVDSGLRLFLSEKKVKKVWRLIYRCNPWRTGGTMVGSIILTLLLQSGAAAQKMGEKAEKAINDVFSPHLTGATDAVSVSFSAGRLFVYAVIGGTLIMAFWDLTQNRGGHVMIWGSILGSIAVGYVLHSMVEKAIFGV